MTNTTWENLQIATHQSVSTPHIVLIGALQFADFLRLCLFLEQLHAQSPFLIPIVFGINLIPFCRYWLSTRCPLLGYALLTWATAWSQLSLFVALAAARCHVKSLPLPQPPLKQRPRRAQRWKKAQDRLLFTIQRCPRTSTSYKLAAFRYRLPPILQTVSVSVKPRLSMATHKA